MRKLSLVFLLAVSSCASPIGRNIPIAPGGSVTDFDRGGGSFYSPETGTPAGEPPSVGTLDFEAPQVVPGPARVEGPPPRLGAPEEIRKLQRELSERGYYEGPINGQEDPALVDALRRFKSAKAASPPRDGGAIM